MKLCIAAIFFALCVGCARKVEQQAPGPFLDPAFANLIPPDTNLLTGIPVERLVKTPVYQSALAGGKIPIVADFAERTGINVEKQLWQVLMVGGPRYAYWLARGKFADELMAPDFSKKGIRRRGYKGTTLFFDDGVGEDARTLMVLNSSTTALGELRVLQDVADIRPSLKEPPARLVKMIQQIPRTAHLWAVYSGGPVRLPLEGNAANLQRLTEMLADATVYLDLSEGFKGLAVGTALNERAAQDVEGALRALQAMSAMSAKSARFGSAFQISREGREITVKIDGPAELAAMLF